MTQLALAALLGLVGEDGNLLAFAVLEHLGLNGRTLDVRRAQLKLGAPYVKGATVEAKVLKNGKGKKITVFTYKPKKGSQRKLGHRQPYTKVQIEAVSAKAPRAAKAKAEAADDAQ